jgi:hypothetical protein
MPCNDDPAILRAILVAVSAEVKNRMQRGEQLPGWRERFWPEIQEMIRSNPHVVH